LSSPGNSLIFQILIIVLLTTINAVFAASEIAFVSVNQSKMRTDAENGDKKSERVLQLLKESDNFLATIQVAITLAGFLSSASAATSFSQMLTGVLPNFPGVQQVSIVVVTVILSYISLVFGELYPKQIALQMPDELARTTSGLVLFVQTAAKPFVKLLSASTNLLRKLTPIDFTEESEKFTRDEMREILSQSHDEGSIDVEEYTMLEGVLSLDNKIAKEIMVPRTDTQMISIDDDTDENVQEILESPFSRTPIYRSEKDNVIGILHVKNLLKRAKNEGFENVNLMQIANDPLFVPATMYVDDLLVEFKRSQQHMAILIDEYGGVEGIVTLEDALEEIVGEIDDESDVDTQGDIRKIDQNNYFVNAGILVEKFNDYFKVDFEKDDVDTLAGAIIREIGYVPTETEQVALRANDFVIMTTRVENGRIYNVRVTKDENRTIEATYEISEKNNNQLEDE